MKQASLFLLVLVTACADVVGADFDKAHALTESGGTGSNTGGTHGGQGGASSSGASSSSSGGAGADGGGVEVGGTGADAGGAPSAGGGTTGGTNAGGASGSGGSSDGGVANGSGGAGGSDACVSTKWCHDTDGDHYGDPNASVVSCNAPGADWVTDCSDCADDNAAVHPGADCGSAGYTTAAGTSFDYDCDGHEDECGTIAKAGTCTIKGVGSCTGSGYLPNPNRPTSTGDVYCGSTAYQTCVQVAVPCGPVKGTKPAVTCH